MTRLRVGVGPGGSGGSVEPCLGRVERRGGKGVRPGRGEPETLERNLGEDQENEVANAGVDVHSRITFCIWKIQVTPIKHGCQFLGNAVLWESVLYETKH